MLGDGLEHGGMGTAQQHRHVCAVLWLLGSGLPLARVAHECSYFDQAHLTHDIRKLTGRSPQRLLAERSAMPPGPRDLDRSMTELTGLATVPAPILL
ncbi:MAG: helix-turn-helix transcriptional regulator [Catenulispora sp.]|nr:helix-turn-helix transcriptional regulator [Catenulispora sp.]